MPTKALASGTKRRSASAVDGAKPGRAAGTLPTAAKPGTATARQTRDGAAASRARRKTHPAGGASRVAEAAKVAKSQKPRKTLVRDSFTMPRDDFDLIGRLKDRALEAKRAAKKSELLRAGLHALNILEAASLAAALDRLVPVKAGRPKKKG